MWLRFYRPNQIGLWTRITSFLHIQFLLTVDPHPQIILKLPLNGPMNLMIPSHKHNFNIIFNVIINYPYSGLASGFPLWSLPWFYTNIWCVWISIIFMTWDVLVTVNKFLPSKDIFLSKKLFWSNKTKCSWSRTLSSTHNASLTNLCMVDAGFAGNVEYLTKK